MFYIPNYHNLSDGRQVFLRFPDPERDAEALLEWLRTVCGETDFLAKGPDEITATVEQEEEYLRKLNSSPEEMMVVAEVAGRIAGTASLRIHANRRAAHRGSVGIALFREFWGLGLGTLLMEAVINTARQKGLRFVELEVVEDNARAIALYEKLGFQTVCRLEAASVLPDGSEQTRLTMRKAL